MKANRIQLIIISVLKKFHMNRKRQFNKTSLHSARASNDWHLLKNLWTAIHWQWYLLLDTWLLLRKMQEGTQIKLSVKNQLCEALSTPWCSGILFYFYKTKHVAFWKSFPLNSKKIRFLLSLLSFVLWTFVLDNLRTLSLVKEISLPFSRIF